MLTAHSIAWVKEELKKLKLNCISIHLGEVQIQEYLTNKERNKLKTILLKNGFELMDDKNALQIEKIKNEIVNMIHDANDKAERNFSKYLAKKLDANYTQMATLFSRMEGITIKYFVLLYKIEKVKELIINNQLSLTEIAWKLNFSNTAHLCSQFKMITGLTPSYFKTLKQTSEQLNARVL